MAEGLQDHSHVLGLCVHVPAWERQNLHGAGGVGMAACAHPLEVQSLTRSTSTLLRYSRNEPVRSDTCTSDDLSSCLDFPSTGFADRSAHCSRPTPSILSWRAAATRRTGTPGQLNL